MKLCISLGVPCSSSIELQCYIDMRPAALCAASIGLCIRQQVLYRRTAGMRNDMRAIIQMIMICIYARNVSCCSNIGPTRTQSLSRPHARSTIDIRPIVVWLASAVIAHLSLIDDRDKGLPQHVVAQCKVCMRVSNEARRRGSRSGSTGNTVQYSVLPVSSLMIRLACALSLGLRGRLYQNTSRSEVATEVGMQ